MKILHIDTGKTFRGGQHQALILHRGLLKKNIESYLVCDKKGLLYKKNFDHKIDISFFGELDLLGYILLNNVIHQIKPDIIHCHESHALTIALLSTFFSPIPIVVTRRVDFLIKHNVINSLKYKNNRIKKWIAISKAIKNALKKFGVCEQKIEIIYSATGIPQTIDENKIVTIKKTYNLENNHVIGTIASLVEHKDIFTLIKAFDLLYDKVNNAKLFILGDGPMYNKLLKEISLLKSKNNIILTGFIDDVYPFLYNFDIFAITSKKEGLCSSIIDAFNMGKPVVATKAGGIPELITHNVNGYLSEVGDFESICNNLLMLIRNNKLYSIMSKNALLSAKNYTSDIMVGKYINVYNEILNEKK